ncbi:MAG: hypothetical protein HRU03_08420 [Nanoarchaeales archaeon]|nr:hypothetical protein [Nanoarchaeales archaeon]
MSLTISLPLGKKQTAKNMIFSILSKEYPLKIIELTNYIKKRYGVSITFQAVRKAIFQLVDETVLIQTQDKKEFMINKKWVHSSKQIIDELYIELNENKSQIKDKSIDSIKGEVSVFSFQSVNEMMIFWQSIIDDWYENFKKGDLKYNCYQGAHTWEGLLHLDKEQQLMGKLKTKGIVSYSLTTGNYPLDKNIFNFYKRLNIKTKIAPSSSTFDKAFYIGTYGDTIVQSQYPDKIVKELDNFFKTNLSLEKLDLGKLSKIMNTQIEVKLTVIKNKSMAKQINSGIINQF